MLLDTDFSDVPDSVPTVEAGQYTFLVKSYEFKEATEGSKKKAAHSYQLQITGGLDGSESPQKGRIVFEDFPPEFFKDKSHPVTIRFKQFLQSAGVALSGGIDPAILVGKSVRGIVSTRTYTDKDGKAKDQAQVKTYVFTK